VFGEAFCFTSRLCFSVAVFSFISFIPSPSCLLVSFAPIIGLHECRRRRNTQSLNGFYSIFIAGRDSF
jgi:hypothetical protein